MRLENVEDVYPLSATQAGMLFHTVAAPGSGVYVEQIDCRLRGVLDRPAFEAAWQSALARHTALRAAFLWDGLDEPLQVVRERVDLPWMHLDWRGRDKVDSRHALDEWLAEDRRTGFDLGQAPLMRMALIRLGDTVHRLVWSFHHILADGWSAAIVLAEVMEDYAARLEGGALAPSASMPYRDYIAWQAGRDTEAAAPFWRDYLRGFRNPTAPVKHRVPDGRWARGPHGVVEARLSVPETARLTALARGRRLTLNTLVQGAWAILLARHAGGDEVVFGTTVSGRPAQLRGVESAVGLFINSVPVRAGFREHETLGEWLARLQANLLAVREYEHTPLNRIQDWADTAPGEPLFETLVVMENYPPQTTTAGLVVEDVRHAEQSNYPLALLVVPGQALDLMLVHDPALYPAAATRDLIEQLRTALSGLPDHLEGDPRTVPLMRPETRQRVVSGWNTTAADYPRDVLVPALIDAQVRQRPDASALVHEGSQVDYAALQARVRKWAHHLGTRGVSRGERVAVCLPPGPELITGILAVLAAGAAYVPLDPRYPAARLDYMLRDSGARRVLTTADLAPALATAGRTLVCMDREPPAVPDTGEMPCVVDEGDPAYVIYTSGSTGEPKGVVVSHGNLLHSTQARHLHYPAPPRVFLLLSSVAFDSSVAGIFWSLTAGATLVIPGARIEQDMARLAECIDRHGVTHLLCLPSLYDLLLAHAGAARLGSLETVILAGEIVPRELPARHRTVLPGVALHNEYGPTEATVWCTVQDIRDHDAAQPVPIGRPVPNTRIYILDERGQPVAPGVPGEIHVAGEGVARGYLDRPEATAQRFIGHALEPVPGARLYRTGDRGRHLPDGSIEFLGRMDRQVKIRGHRVETAEIEAVLSAHPGVREAAVVPVAPVDSAADLARRLHALGESRSRALLSEIEGLGEVQA